MNKTFIGGAWLEHSGLTLDCVSPEDLRTIDVVPLCRAGEVDHAVSAARDALPGWRRVDVKDRAALVEGLAAAIEAAYGSEGVPSELKELVTQETGKRPPEADIEVIESADMVRYFGAVAESALKSESPALDQNLWPSKVSNIVLEPRGVVAVIKPWNYPFEIPLWAIAPALVSGNAVVFKPSEHSSLVGLAIAKLIEEAGFPAGVFNVVTGDGTTGALLAGHADVDMVSFTGSVSTGKKIATVAAERMTYCSLELGGNDAAIVLADADLELAAKGLTWGAVCNSGQVCVGVKRIFAVAEIYDELVDRMLNEFQALRPSVDYGPLISRQQVEAAKAFVSDALSKGAQLLTGGDLVDGQGPLYFAPTLLSDTPSDSRLAVDECFAPLAPMFRVATVDDAIARANDSNYGLGASVWTRSRDAFSRVADALVAGMVWENDVNVAFPQTPWGGRRLSGTGCELSTWGLHEYVEPKHLSYESSADTRRAWWYPYESPVNS